MYIGGSDFTFGPYLVIFPAGVTRIAFNVTIIDDKRLEHDENFTLTTDLFTLPERITIGSSGHTTITILNDDSKQFYAKRSFILYASTQRVLLGRGKTVCML